VVNADRRTGASSGWPVWVGLLNRGFHLTAVGGSDEHTPLESADRKLGTPATVVYAVELSESAIVTALKSGRVYIVREAPMVRSSTFQPMLLVIASRWGRRFLTPAQSR
jgi:hypothetical protein